MERRGRRAARYAVYGLVGLGGVMTVLAVVAFFVLVDTYRAPSPSMEPGVGQDDRFAVIRLGAPGVGDIVVFNPPKGAEAVDRQCAREPREGAVCTRPTPGRARVSLVKRVVAVGGDRIAIRDGRVVRNGRLEKRRITPCGTGEGCNYPVEVTIPDGHVFMMGDNRGRSDDSRFWGPVPEDWVIGRHLLTYKKG